MRSFLLIILLTTQTSCAFVVSAAGSFVGNLGAEFAEEKIKEMRDMEDKAYCDPMGVRNCPKEKETKDELE